MSLRVDYSWSTNEVPLDLGEWRVYASSDRKAKGQLVATEQADARSATWEAGESLIYVRVLGVKKDGTEEAWTDVEPDEVFVQGRDAVVEPDAPATIEVAHVEPSLQGRVTLDPPTTADPASFVQVIQGADEFVGVLLAEQKVLPSGPIGPDGPPQQVSTSFPMEGYGGTKSVTVRQMGAAGRPGTGTARTVREPDEMPGHHEVAIASWSGTTRVNFPAAAATDTFEYDATDGCRARTRPVVSSATGGAAGWGTLASGILASSPLGGAYMRSMTVESDEVDLGSTLTFRLTISHTGGRKSAAGAVTGRKLETFKTPLIPAGSIDTRAAVEGLAWFAREVRFDGKPRQPLRDFRWEYVVGTSSPVAHASSDYKPYVPGQLLRGRYVRVRLVATEPTGYHQLVVPTATIKALVQRRTPVSTATPEAAVVAPPGSHFVRTDGPPYHYVKATGTGNTGWVASNTPADGSITNAQLADMAESTIKGRAVGAGTGDPTDLSATQATAILNAMVGDSGAGGTKGLAPAPAAGDAAAGKFLKADGTWTAPTAAAADVFSTIVAKTANYTIVSPTDNGTTFDCDSSGGAFTMTLPTAPSSGFRVAIMRRAGTSAALTVTVQAGGADVIRGPRSTAGTSFALQLYESVVLTYYATPGVWLAAAHSSTADAGTSIASLRTLGTGSLQACAGSDSRLSDNRIPTDASVSEAKLTDAVWTAIYFGV